MIQVRANFRQPEQFPDKAEWAIDDARQLHISMPTDKGNRTIASYASDAWVSVIRVQDPE